jgi:hypothetical protein
MNADVCSPIVCSNLLKSVCPARAVARACARAGDCNLEFYSNFVCYAAGSGFRIAAGRIFLIKALTASCVTMHKSMHLTSVGDCLYSMVCCSEGLEANPELESWIPTSPTLSPTWWTLLREFNNFYHELMTDMFHWEVPGRGGAKGRELQRLRNALPGSIGSERKMGADIWMAMQAVFQLNMQKRRPPMMPSGVGDDMHRRARFTTYLKTSTRAYNESN